MSRAASSSRIASAIAKSFAAREISMHGHVPRPHEYPLLPSGCSIGLLGPHRGILELARPLRRSSHDLSQAAPPPGRFTRYLAGIRLSCYRLDKREVGSLNLPRPTEAPPVICRHVRWLPTSRGYSAAFGSSVGARGGAAGEERGSVGGRTGFVHRQQCLKVGPGPISRKQGVCDLCSERYRRTECGGC